MRSILIALIVLPLIGCEQKASDLKETSSGGVRESCSENNLPLGLKFGMSASEIDSLISDGILENYFGADGLEGYKVVHGGKRFLLSFHNGKLMSLVVNYKYRPDFDNAFTILRQNLGLYRFPGGDGFRFFFGSLAFSRSPDAVDKMPNTLPSLPSNSYNDVFFGSICNDMLVIAEEYESWSRIWYTSIPGPTDSLPSSFTGPFNKAYPYVTSIYRISNPNGFYRPLKRDY